MINAIEDRKTARHTALIPPEIYQLSFRCGAGCDATRKSSVSARALPIPFNHPHFLCVSAPHWQPYT